MVFQGHTDTIRSVVWSQNERHILSASLDRSVRVWEAETAGCIQVLKGHEACVINSAWTPPTSPSFRATPAVASECGKERNISGGLIMSPAADQIAPGSYVVATREVLKNYHTETSKLNQLNLLDGWVLL